MFGPGTKGGCPYPDVSDDLDAFGLGGVESAYGKFMSMCSWCFHVSNFQF